MRDVDRVVLIIRDGVIRVIHLVDRFEHCLVCI